MESLKEIAKKFEKEKNTHISREFQDYGYRLAVTLNDLKHKALYIKLAKEKPRGILQIALEYVSDSQAKNKGALFMWKLKELLKKEKTNDSTTNTTT